MEKFILKIYRGSPGNQYFDEFELSYHPSMNIISALMRIQEEPVDRFGNKVTPVVWEMGCLEEVCGSCSMLINGYPRQSCTAIISNIIKKTGSNIITLAPLSKFNLVKDLMVDRTSMFESLKKVHAYIEVDSSFNDQSIPFKIDPRQQEILYSLSKCMTCGVCLEACPQVNEHSTFMGAAAISQVRLFNIHPLGKVTKTKRLEAMMQKEGVIGCGNAQNCVKVCPKNIPLTESISVIFKETIDESLKKLFSSPEKQ
jgi:succinate dehydrogenase / fumarate reductase iron-sulfur subunit